MPAQLRIVWTKSNCFWMTIFLCKRIPQINLGISLQGSTRAQYISKQSHCAGRLNMSEQPVSTPKRKSCSTSYRSNPARRQKLRRLTNAFITDKHPDLPLETGDHRSFPHFRRPALTCLSTENPGFGRKMTNFRARNPIRSASYRIRCPSYRIRWQSYAIRSVSYRIRSQSYSIGLQSYRISI